MNFVYNFPKTPECGWMITRAYRLRLCSVQQCASWLTMSPAEICGNSISTTKTRWRFDTSKMSTTLHREVCRPAAALLDLPFARAVDRKRDVEPRRWVYLWGRVIGRTKGGRRGRLKGRTVQDSVTCWEMTNIARKQLGDLLTFCCSVISRRASDSSGFHAVTVASQRRQAMHTHSPKAQQIRNEGNPPHVTRSTRCQIIKTRLVLACCSWTVEGMLNGVRGTVSASEICKNKVA